MKTIIIIVSVALCSLFTTTYAQEENFAKKVNPTQQENLAQIRNYSGTPDLKESVKKISNKTDFDLNIKKQTNTKTEKKENVTNVTKEFLSEVEYDGEETIKQRVLFQETFSEEALENKWLEVAGTKNMMGYNDSTYGKVLKISNKQPQISFIEYYLDNSYKGKNLKLECKIKVENIQKGENKYDIGQLAIEYQVDETFVYPAVQGLVYTKDWDTYYAREDGSTDIDNTGLGHFVFKIPENAKNIRLYLGLQNCTGTIYFKDLIIYEILE
ncbi:MAG: hypothetical protein M0Q41_07440 [Bacteroidales bacterium]|nr:hypothetical protein [Acholeplasmataceae bacterium]MCK9448798.1 hypothetical protein [Bacteroidales bacterium]